MTYVRETARVRPGGAAQAWAALRKPLLLMTGLVAAGLVIRETGGVLDPNFLERLGNARGAWDETAFVLAGATLCAVGVPRQAVAFAASYTFGLWPGASLALAAQTIGCIAAFAWTRAVGRDWAAARLRGRLARADRFLAANPFTATLVLRLLPIGNNLVLNLLAGVSGVATLPFVAASVLGYVPQTVVFALLGAGIRVAEGVQVAIAIVLFAGSSGLGMWLLRRERKLARLASTEDEGDEEDGPPEKA